MILSVIAGVILSCTMLEGLGQGAKRKHSLGLNFSTDSLVRVREVSRKGEREAIGQRLSISQEVRIRKDDSLKMASIQQKLMDLAPKSDSTIQSTSSGRVFKRKKN